ncbi:MAG TPA: Asp-tRNA(Asn)/Glu-tRNA(Gln) amidotransferase subunit GatB [Candidatus Eremiobacteraeota bacterium]|nr:Asp-tRNA(Asn)/Glu-tRNA(Gln) amidotransferase subunit GatB [Candidatus Eremiobacteraeota bacterium]
MSYYTIIGLEVHVELLTETKMFCSCSTKFGSLPNSNVCPVCLGLPGVLPVINKKAVEYLLKVALSLDCKIPHRSKFDRKNYFYPDMPKNYQISQYDLPLSQDGFLEIEIDGNRKKIGIERIHLEEDTGKSIHTGTIDKSLYTLEDFNRAGVPLLEIVSKPHMSSPEEAGEYLKELRAILFSLGISDCKMEEGSLRCDANISVNKEDFPELSRKVEIKNMNSFKSVQKALFYEIKRQTEMIERGEAIQQETRGWLEEEGKTIFMRGKEMANDYRYFPEPDLLPLEIDRIWLEEIKNTIPELPREKKRRFVKDYNISNYEATVLCDNFALSKFFEETVRIYDKAPVITNWLLGDISKYLNAENLEITSTKLTPENLSEMLSLIDNKVISGKIGKDIIEEMLRSGKKAEKIVQERGLLQISDEEVLWNLIRKVMDENSDAVKEYLKGKTKALGYLVGQVMKQSKGKANPQITNSIILEELQKKTGEA